MPCPSSPGGSDLDLKVLALTIVALVVGAAFIVPIITVAEGSDDVILHEVTGIANYKEPDGEAHTITATYDASGNPVVTSDGATILDASSTSALKDHCLIAYGGDWLIAFGGLKDNDGSSSWVYVTVGSTGKLLAVNTEIMTITINGDGTGTIAGPSITNSAGQVIGTMALADVLGFITADEGVYTMAKTPAMVMPDANVYYVANNDGQLQYCVGTPEDPVAAAYYLNKVTSSGATNSAGGVHAVGKYDAAATYTATYDGPVSLSSIKAYSKTSGTVFFTATGYMVVPSSWETEVIGETEHSALNIVPVLVAVGLVLLAAGLIVVRRE